MLQDHSRNRTPMPAAQPPADTAPPEPGPARAEAGIARMLAAPAGEESSPDAAFLALAPTLLPMLDEFDRLWAIASDAHARAIAALGGEPDYHVVGRAAADEWDDRLHTSRGWFDYIEARKPADALGARIQALVAAHMEVPVRTLDGLLLKHHIGRSFTQYEDIATSDLNLMVATQVAADTKSGLIDPLLAGIARTRAALDHALAVEAAHRRGGAKTDLPPAWHTASDAAQDAFLALKETPTTRADCQALARLTLDLREGLGLDLEEETLIVLKRIAGEAPPQPDADQPELPGGQVDVELIVLGRQFDALHAEWRRTVEANREPSARREAAVKAAGCPSWDVERAAWELPGVAEASNAEADAFDALEPVCEEILRLPARTVAGFAVKARTLIWAVWPGGGYERDASTDHDGDYTKRCVCAFIETACAAAGVDWRGETTGSVPVVSEAHPPVAAPQEQDPRTLLDAIQAHEKAWQAYSRANAAYDALGTAEGQRPASAAADEAATEASNRSDQAWRDLFEAQPRSLHDLWMLLTHIERHHRARARRRDRRCVGCEVSAVVPLIVPRPVDRAALRRRVELAIEQALDAAACLIAFLDDIDGDADAEDDGTAEPRLAALIAGDAQIRWAGFEGEAA
ncbi:MAG: hypothetical protein PGN25_15105 [Methylorubrum populi]